MQQIHLYHRASTVNQYYHLYVRSLMTYTRFRSTHVTASSLLTMISLIGMVILVNNVNELLN
jgi:hypothetical protein